ncbi:hypothetical protein BDZ89DRAFT_976017 [Hymenopellis radicata]|nr:hypothetical protein BDZ89DRAFT_993259 [Hymenopellis radicata]KAF9055543.1 hypothetical protein BDZ89DRAFT_976017 [Hymenopellis radicata]
MAVNILSARLNFSSERSAPGAFEFPLVYRVPSGEPLHLRPGTVPMHDLRQEGHRPSLDTEGYTWQSLPFDGLDGAPGWEERYARECSEWLKDFIGAQTCVPMNTQIRRRDSGSDGQPVNDVEVRSKQPVPAVHVDVSRERAVQRLLGALGPDFDVEGRRIALINIWRPLRGPVMDAPLAVCDARTVDVADMDATTDRFGGGYFLKQTPKMKWSYIRDQTADEIIVFRQFDSGIEHTPGAAACVPHTAFIDEERKNQGLPRESIELRCAVVY